MHMVCVQTQEIFLNEKLTSVQRFECSLYVCSPYRDCFQIWFGAIFAHPGHSLAGFHTWVECIMGWKRWEILVHVFSLSIESLSRDVWAVINLISCVLLQVCRLASCISFLLCWCIHPCRIPFPLVHSVWARLPIESVFHCSNSFPCLRFHNHLIAS
mgnify:CR=1 FL=1